MVSAPLSEFSAAYACLKTSTSGKNMTGLTSNQIESRERPSRKMSKFNKLSPKISILSNIPNVPSTAGSFMEDLIQVMGRLLPLWVIAPCFTWSWRSYLVLTGLAGTILWLLNLELRKFMRCVACDHGAGDALSLVFFDMALWLFMCLALGRLLTLVLKQTAGWPRHKVFFLEALPLFFLIGFVGLSLAFLEATRT
ncbi:MULTISPECIES: hypothetical protein [unclassified Hyphomonas]|uniref:hypothetical protein n=1 Tax=unclassified Hyphomonas TaxID=2630699 RepID=UPI0011120001|nr:MULTISPECIES: hypothetical protein [unclassified Hyphomonas]